MGHLLPPNLNTPKPSSPIPPPPPPRIKTVEPVDPVEPSEPTKPKEETRFSFSEKFKLFIIIIAAVIIPVFGTFAYTRYSYRSDLQNYKDFSENQINDLRNQINILTNPSIKQLDQYENIIKSKKSLYNKEKEELEKDAVFQEIIKKTKELDKQIIICNVHLHNIEIVKQNNYKEVDTLLEKLNKENIK
jgi:hypothetical protein